MWPRPTSGCHISVKGEQFSASSLPSSPPLPVSALALIARLPALDATQEKRARTPGASFTSFHSPSQGSPTAWLLVPELGKPAEAWEASKGHIWFLVRGCGLGIAWGLSLV